MIDARAVQNQVHRKINRINSRFSGYVKVSDTDEYINEALSTWTRNQIARFEINSESRIDLRILEIKDFQVSFEERGNKVVAEFPSNYLKLLNQKAIASIDCEDGLNNCLDCKGRNINIRIVQSGEINELLDDPYWEPSFEWHETIGDEAYDGLHVWHNKKFDISKILLDYVRKPKEVRTPSLMKEGYYTIGNTKYTKDQGLELDQAYQVNEITDLAALFILRDFSDSQEYQTQVDKILRTNTTYVN